MFHAFEMVNRNNGTKIAITQIGRTRADAEFTLREYNFKGTDFENVWELREPNALEHYTALLKESQAEKEAYELNNILKGFEMDRAG